MRLVIEASVATSDEIKEFVEVLLVEVRLVTNAFVVVELPITRLMMFAAVATREEMKELEVVALVVDALVAKRLVVVALTAVRLVVDALVRYACVAVTPVPDAVLKVV